MELRKLLSREVGLLLKSESSQDHQWLIKHLNFGKPFEPNKVEFSEQERAMYSNNIEYIITAANKEWRLRDENPFIELENGTAVCQICGNTQTKKIFYIKNQLTGNELNVGSECIQRFKIAKTGTIAQTMQEFQENRQRTRLMQSIPDIFVKAVSWKNEIKVQPYVIPNKLANRFLKICAEIESEYNKYIKSKDEPSVDLIEKFKTLISTGEQYLDEIGKYIKEINLISRPATRKVWTWMKQRQDEGIQTALKNIEETGQVLWIDAWRITENGFMVSLIDEINDFLKKTMISIKFIDVDGGSDRNGRYIIEASAIDGSSIKLSCHHGELFLECGDILLGEESNDDNNIQEIVIKNSIPYSSKDTNQMIVIARNNLLGNIILAPEYDNNNTDMIAVLNKNTGLFAWINENTLAKILVPFSVNLQDERSIMNEIEKLHLKWMDKKEIKELLDVEKIMKNKY